ncbi:MAG TPA: LysR family transcriptional regulator [Symbiobacteriaceae bacterium]|nr:LysR family transcriptional regulator [Symbiobacteriaceae bacterium]
MIHLLQTLCAVAESGSLSRAAEALHLTQPAVTRQIKALEQELGAVLINRTPHGVGLTPAGAAVLAHARQALAAVEACRRAAREAAPEGAGQLRVAAGHMIMQFLLPPVLATFRAAHPEVQVELHTGHYQECIDWLTGYQADLVLISTTVAGSGLKSSPLLKDPVVAVTPAGAPLGGGAAVNLTDLAGLVVLALPRQAGFRQQVGQVLAGAGVPHQIAEHPTVEAVKTMAALGMGVALLPGSAVADEVERGRLSAVPVQDWPDHGRTVLAVTRSEGQPPEAVKTFLSMIRAHHRT